MNVRAGKRFTLTRLQKGQDGGYTLVLMDDDEPDARPVALPVIASELTASERSALDAFVDAMARYADRRFVALDATYSPTEVAARQAAAVEAEARLQAAVANHREIAEKTRETTDALALKEHQLAHVEKRLEEAKKGFAATEERLRQRIARG